MHKVLAAGLSTLLFLDIAGALSCLNCQKLNHFNNCKHTENTCNIHFEGYCYVRKINEGLSTKLDRGCTFQCRHIKNKKYNYEERMLCCSKDLCNHLKI